MRTHTTTRSLALVGLAGAAVGGAGSAPLTAAATGVTCGTVVTTDLRLTADLIDCPGAALVIGADGVTVDLAGHVLDGTGAGAGIDNGAGHDRIRVVGGTIRDFTFGIHLFDTSNARIDGVAVEGNATGVVVERSEKVVVDGVEAVGNTFAGIDVTFSRRVTVTGSAVADGALFGIVDRFSDESRYDGNLLTGNVAPGLTVDRTSRAAVERNQVASGDGDGIVLVGVEDAVLSRNAVVGNEGNGIAIDAPGNVLDRNVARDNGGIGIAAPVGTIDRGRNEASGNGAGDCTGVVCG